MLGFRPLPVPGLITAGSPIPHPGLCCVSRKGQPCPTPCRTLELTVFWLFDGAIKAFDYDVLVFLGELLLPMYSKGRTGCCYFFMWLEVPTFPVFPHNFSTHTLFCTFAHLELLLLCSQSGACLVFHYLQPPPRCTSAFSAFRWSLISYEFSEIFPLSWYPPVFAV